VDAINAFSYLYVMVSAFLWLTLGGSWLSLVTGCIFYSTVGHREGSGGRLVLAEPLVLPWHGRPSALSINAPLDSSELGESGGGARRRDRAEVMKLPPNHVRS